MTEEVTREDFHEYMKKFKDWRKLDRGSLDSLLKRLLAAKFTREFQNTIDGLMGHVFKEVVNSEHAEKSLIGELNQLKKKLKQNEKVLQQQQKLEKNKIDEKGTKDTSFPQELTLKLEGRHCDYARHIFKSFIRNFKEADTRQPTIIEFVRKLEKELYEFFEGDDPKILKHLQEIRFNMEPAAAQTAKLMMLDGSIEVKDVIQNKSSTYTATSRKSSQDDGDKKVAPSFPKGHGEECEKCKENEAYCWRMVQIRASDEPMTRFMRCRACNFEWTDN